MHENSLLRLEISIPAFGAALVCEGVDLEESVADFARELQRLFEERRGRIGIPSRMDDDPQVAENYCKEVLVPEGAHRADTR